MPDGELSETLEQALNSGRGERRSRFQMSKPSKLERVGLGWRALFPGLELRLSRIRESGGELSGELAVRYLDGDHLLLGRLNVSSFQTRGSIAKVLRERTGIESWPAYLEAFCVAILAAQRTGEPVQTIGDMPPEAVPPYILAPILRQDLPTVLFGPGGTGKSTLAAGIAVSVASGSEVVPGWKPMSAPVLVLDFEDTARTWDQRVKKIAAGAGIRPPQILYRWSRQPLVADVEQVAALVAERAIGLVVVDPVALALESGHPESDPNFSVGRMFTALRMIGATSLLLDHVAGADLQKPGSLSKPIGGVMKINQARCVFELRREKEPYAGRTELLLAHTKVNDGPLLRPQGLVIAHDERAITFESGQPEAPELVGMLSPIDRMTRTLKVNGALSARELGELTSLPQGTIRSVISRDREHRFVRLQDQRIGLAAHTQEAMGL